MPGAPKRSDCVLVNGAFRPQQITGQQRYATEIASRLSEAPAFEEIAPEGRWAGSAARTWMWTQTVLPMRARGTGLVSLTSRAPVAHRRQLVVIHDLFPLTHPEWYSRRYLAVHVPLLKYQLRNARALVAVSQPVADEIEALGWAGNVGAVAVAPNAPARVFLEKPDEPTGDLPASVRQLLETSTGFFLGLGAHDPRKNTVALVRAHQQLDEEVRRQFPLVLLGAEHAAFRARTDDHDELVRFIGYVSDTELRALYRLARAFVFPTLAEGFGLPLIESLSAGGRVITTDLPICRWVCGDAADYVPLDDLGSLVEKLEAAAVEPPALPPAYLERFDWDRSAQIVRETALQHL